MLYNVEIPKEKALEILELSKDFLDDFENVLSEVNISIHPAGIYRIYNSINIGSKTITINDKVFSCGHKICKALEGSEQIALILVTIGEDINTLIKRYTKDYDLLKSYWCDKLANWALYEVIKKVKEQLKNECQNKNMKITSHWGPGYCGWPITEQSMILSLLPSQEIGITLSSSMLMNPVKSLSGIIGIGKDVVYKESGCADCKLEKCAYRSIKW